MRSSALLLAFVLLLLTPSAVPSAGISVDAGLTPAEDRWVLRAQVRHMSRGEEPGGKIKQLMFPVVLAYGVRSNVTLVARQAVVWRERTVSGSSSNDTGLGDTYAFVKYKAFRSNSRTLIFGVAPTLGLEMPTGQSRFTSDTWDLRVGVYASTRTQTWSSDVNIAYARNDVFNEIAVSPGDEVSVDAATAYQFVIDSRGTVTASPVLEFSYLKVRPDRVGDGDAPNTGESVFYVSPGAKLSTRSIIFEGLVRIPVHDHLVGNQPKRNVQGLLGFRYLF